MSFQTRALVLALTTAMLSSSARIARAEPADGSDNDRTIIELDAQANAAYQSGAYESAAKMFTKLYEQTGDANYLYNVSACHDRAERFEEAIDALDRYAAESPDHDAAKVAAKRRSLQVRLEAKAERRDDGDELKNSTDDESQEDPAPAVVPPETEDAGEAGKRSLTLDVIGGVALGLGVTGVAVGIGLGLESNERKDIVEADCVPGDAGLICSEDQRGDVKKQKSFALGADIAIAAGATLAVGGIAVLVVNTVRAKRGRERLSLSPSFGARMTGMSLSGRF